VERVFIKFGGSFISPKRSKREMLLGSRIENAARKIRKALDYAEKNGAGLSIVLGHGAGRFGHAPAKHFAARQGYTARFGWAPLPRIREAMLRMNLRFIEHCRRGGLLPLTVSPFAVAAGSGGRLARLDTTTIRQLLKNGQIPLIHGDIILDSRQGFAIASTEELLAQLAGEIRFDRIVMLTDVDGVLDRDGVTIPLITPRNIQRHLGSLSGSRGPDVTGGMSDKVKNLLRLVESGRVKEARIMTAAPRSRALLDAILGAGHAGTLIRKR
jgi:isopentenyl phosphate kinase